MVLDLPLVMRIIIMFLHFIQAAECGRGLQIYQTATSASDASAGRALDKQAVELHGNGAQPFQTGST